MSPVHVYPTPFIRLASCSFGPNLRPAMAGMQSSSSLGSSRSVGLNNIGSLHPLIGHITTEKLKCQVEERLEASGTNLLGASKFSLQFYPLAWALMDFYLH